MDVNQVKHIKRAIDLIFVQLINSGWAIVIYLYLELELLKLFYYIVFLVECLLQDYRNNTEGWTEQISSSVKTTWRSFFIPECLAVKFSFFIALNWFL